MSTLADYIGRLTPTMIASYLRCPEAFRRRYIEGEVIPPGIAFAVGRSVHQALRLDLETHKHQGEHLPEKTLREVASDTFLTIVKKDGLYVPPDMTAAKLVAEGTDRLLPTYVTGLGRWLPDVAAEEFELPLELDLEIGEDKIPLRGRLDLVGKTSQAKGIIEFKTASRRWSDAQIRQDIQMPLYQFMARNTGTAPHDRIGLAVDVASGQPMVYETWLNYWPVMQSVVRIVAAVANAIKKGSFPPAQPGSWMCNPHYCGYYKSCPYAR